MLLFYYFNFQRNYLLKSMSPCILLNKNTNFNTKRNRKWKIPHTILERRTLCFSSHKNRKLKVKLWWVRACERKKRAFFLPFILCDGNFFKIYVLSHYMVHWNTFRPHTFCCLFLKSSKAFSVSLNLAFHNIFFFLFNIIYWRNFCFLRF